MGEHRSARQDGPGDAGPDGPGPGRAGGGDARGHGGGGAVRVVVTGTQEVRQIAIDPAAVDPAEVEMLQDLVLAAVTDALARSKGLRRREDGRGDRRDGPPGARRSAGPALNTHRTGSVTGLIAPVARLIEEFNELPGVGPKTAQRLTYHVLPQPDREARGLAEAPLRSRRRWPTARPAGTSPIAGSTPAPSVPIRRDATRICVVEEPLDVLAIDRTGEYHGRYHVLHGAISPMDGIGPERIRARELVARADGGGLEEMILATNPNLEGEATAMYLADLLGTSVPECPASRGAAGRRRPRVRRRRDPHPVAAGSPAGRAVLRSVRRAGTAARRADSPLVLALDIGSSSVRAGLHDRWGRSLQGTEVQVPYAWDISPTGAVRLAVQTLADLVGEALDQLVAVAGALTPRSWPAASPASSTASGPRWRRPADDARPLLGRRDQCRRSGHSRTQVDPDRVHRVSGVPIHAAAGPLAWFGCEGAAGDQAMGRLSRAGGRTVDRAGAVSRSMASGTGLFDRARKGGPPESAREAGHRSWGPATARGRRRIARPALADRRAALAAARRPSWFAAWGDGSCGDVGLGAGYRGRPR